MSEVEYSVGRLGVEPGEVVVELQLLTVRGVSRERLYYNRIGRCPQVTEYPSPALFVRSGVGNPGSELGLSLQVLQSGGPIEFMCG